MKKYIVFILLGASLISAKPTQDGKQAIKEMDVAYFMDNCTKPKNEIWVCYFWATWCMNCVKSHGILASLDQEFKNQHVRLISLSLDQKKGKWEQFIAEHPAEWEQAYLADTPFDKKFRKTFGSIENLPQLFIIKRDGTATRVKYLNQLKSELQKLLESE
ncbi:MAG: TlpA family protein disulfide reductase [Bacteroidetes bacterium]|nr:TlpA family protein disulfide reductase [Bacteroidota bacterium]